tara:strand:+ start:50 stop:250 length:201 start_codon:yes stop_codon:yes gene_type:complete
MPAGTITDPALTATHTIEGTVLLATIELGIWFSQQVADTVIHSITTVRSENSQGVSIIIAFETPAP